MQPRYLCFLTVIVFSIFLRGQDYSLLIFKHSEPKQKKADLVIKIDKKVLKPIQCEMQADGKNLKISKELTLNELKDAFAGTNLLLYSEMSNSATANFNQQVEVMLNNIILGKDINNDSLSFIPFAFEDSYGLMVYSTPKIKISEPSAIERNETSVFDLLPLIFSVGTLFVSLILLVVFLRYKKSANNALMVKNLIDIKDMTEELHNSFGEIKGEDKKLEELLIKGLFLGDFTDEPTIIRILSKLNNLDNVIVNLSDKLQSQEQSITKQMSYTVQEREFSDIQMQVNNEISALRELITAYHAKLDLILTKGRSEQVKPFSNPESKKLF